MTISVIVPTYMEEKYLPDTLQAILRQTVLPDELIISDASSTDKTREIAGVYTDKIVITTQRGIAHGRNLGAGASNGDILIFVDADTILPEKAIAQIIGALSDPKVSVVSFYSTPTKESFATWIIWGTINILSHLSCLINRPSFTGYCVACRREDFEQIGGFNEAFIAGEDIDFSFRLGRLGKGKILDDFVITSSRRFDKNGFFSVWQYFFTVLGNMLGFGHYPVVR